MIRKFFTSREAAFGARNSARPGTRRLYRSRPALESLEGRQLMSIDGYQQMINTKTGGYQLDAHTATSSDGNTVVVWTDQFVAGSGDYDIRAQRYNSFGGKLGPEIIVADTQDVEDQPSVAINNTGQFVVSYTDVVGNDENVLAQRFDSSGTAVGGPVQVAISGGGIQEDTSDVGMDDQGNFVVAFDQTAYGGSHVYAHQYNSAGQLTNVINVSSTFANQYDPSVAMSPDGRFYVTWEQEYSLTDFDVYANSYSASGALTSTYIVSYSTANDQAPSISADDHGNAVVAWQQGGDIKARRLSLKLDSGPVINIAASTPETESAPSVALNKQGGGFVVTYNHQPTGGGPVFGAVAEVSSFNTVTTTGAGAFASVSIDAYGDYLIAFEAYPTITYSDIYGQRGHLNP